MSRSLLEADSIILRYGEKTILSDVYLKCEAGEITGIVGRNGCGKSSLLKIIFGTLQAESQSVRLNGKFIKCPYKNHNLVRYLPQENFLPAHLKVREVMDLFISDPKQRVNLNQEELLKKVRGSYIRSLSGGEKRYLGTLLMLFSEAKFVLLDEPFTHLSPIQSEHLKNHLREQSATKGIVITDHIYEHVTEISTSLLVIRNGKTIPVKDRQEMADLGYLPKSFKDNAKGQKEYDLFKPAGRLAIDQQTFRDLDIFTSEDGSSCIFDLLDHTITEGGQMVLKEILSCPKNNAEEIIAMQQVLKYLQERPVLWETNISRSDAKTVETWLDSNTAPMGGKGKFSALTGGLWYRILYPRDHDFLRFGLTKLQLVLQEMKGLYQLHKNMELPPYLTTNMSRLKSFFNKDSVTNFLLISRFAWYEVFLYDKIFREDLKEDIAGILDFFYESEALRSLATSGTKYSFSFPEFHPVKNHPLRAEKLFHPFLKDPVKNEVNYNPEKNFIFLTGANMAGKTTYMKSCGLALYLAHIGMAVPAQRMELSAYDSLFSSINTYDNLKLGYSYFYSEVRRVKEVAVKLSREERVFVMFDELFKGTNVKDAFDCSHLIISGFCNWPESTFLVSSHLTELELEIKKSGNILFCSFDSKIVKGKPEFSYKLKEGVSAERLGLLILENENVTELLNKPSSVSGKRAEV